jgi:hypothetical protein
MAPDLQSLELFSSWNVEFLSILLLSAFLVNFKKTLGDNGCSMSDAGNLSSKEVSFFSWEWRVAID